ncbi:unnamed protein product [Cunninghamella blakesleeana]
MIILSSLLLVVTSINLVNGIRPQQRFRQGCVILQQNLHCYGGGIYVAGAQSYNKVLNDHYVLDLSKDFVINDNQEAWQALQPSNNFILEPNYAFGMAAASNNSFIVTSGSGYNDARTFLRNKTVIYNADDNTWSSVPSPTLNQTVGGSANFDGQNNVYFFGGKSIYSYTLPLTSLFNLAINTNQWQLAPLGNPTVNALYRSDHASDIDTNGVIHYVGGYQGVPTGASYNWRGLAPMTSIPTYDTKKQQWGSIRTNGAIPNIRNLHTFTYMPKTDSFVLFGGKQGDSETTSAVPDICYTFNGKNGTWISQNVKTLGTGSRYGHAAVLYKDIYLFIIFGGDTGNAGLNDYHILNVNTWQWLDKFNADGNPPPPSNNNGGNSTDPNGGKNPGEDSGSISSGAIAGIVVGVIALFGICGALFWFIRKRKEKPKNPRESRDQFVVEQSFDDPVPPPQYYSPTAVNFISNSQKSQPQQYSMQDMQEQRSYIPDEFSTSSAPTYTSSGTDPQRVYKPDLLHDDKPTISPVSTVKPYSKD